MKFYAINGSPRKNCNTAQVLLKSLDGVKSVFPDADCEIINLYNFDFKGCKSCFACKRLGSKHYGKCPVNDGLNEILNKISMADGIILGSPIYLGSVTGVMRSFLERFIFPYLVYDDNYTSLAPKKMPLGFIYTMNITEELADSESFEYKSIFSKTEKYLELIFTKPYNLYVYDTYQFRDYSKFKVEKFDEKEKAKVRKEQFPKDLENAFNLGLNIANDSLES